MAVPTWIAPAITSITNLPPNPGLSGTNATREAYVAIRTYMAANNGAWPSDAAATIRNAILADKVAFAEMDIRRSLLSEFQRIQAAG